jgi:hypothetical protein
MSSYSDKLRDPRWQRKRLEVLEQAGWKCESCESTTKTLHVHHKQYVKGREPWDYETSNFEALCEDCHESAHNDKELINTILAAIPSVMWSRVAALLAGYGAQYVSMEVIKRACDLSEADLEAGMFAWDLGDLDLAKYPTLRERFNELMRRSD